MGQTKLKGNPVAITGDLPAVGAAAPDFSLTRQNLSDATLATFAGKKKVLNIFPSIDTPVCATSVRTFNQRAASLGDVVVLNVAADLPFAFKRFCGGEGIDVETLSTFRSGFAKDYGVQLADGPMAGLCARAVVVLDAENKVVHTELVDDIVNEPNYDAALGALS